MDNDLYHRSVERFLVEEVEKGMNVFPQIGDCSTCPTGARYVTFATGIKAEGECGLTHASVSSARDHFLSSVLSYRTESKGMLFWRCKPEVEEVYSDPMDYNEDRVPQRIYLDPIFKGYTIYARLVIDEPKENERG